MFGYLKGSAVGPEQTFHLTGFGDFSVDRIDVLRSPLEDGKSSLGCQNGVYLSQSPTNPVKVELFAEGSQNRICEGGSQLQTELGAMMIEEGEVCKGDKEEGKTMEEEEKLDPEDDDNDNDVSYDEDDAKMLNMEEEKFLYSIIFILYTLAITL